MMQRWKLYVIVLVCLGGVVVLLSNCSGAPFKNTPPFIADGARIESADGDVISLNQGWNEVTRAWWWFTTQGTRLTPYSWFLHLEQATSTDLFRSDDNMRRLRYLVEKPSRLNPDGLPVGFAKDKAESGEPWFGVTCAACHTAQMDFNGQSIRAEGGPALTDFNGLVFRGILPALKATQGDSAKLDRFVANVLGANPSQAATDTLKAHLAQRIDFFETRARTSAAPDSLAGYARLDAVNNIFNAVFGEDLGIEGAPNTQPADAPVSYPAVWDAPHTDLVQWAGFVDNSAVGGPTSRNLGEVLGVFADFHYFQASRGEGYESSVRVKKQGWLEDDALKHLWSPKWPEHILGAIDPADSTAGRKTFITYCISCHADIDRTDGHRKISALMWPLHYIGTDAENADDFARRALEDSVATGKIEGTNKSYIQGPPFGSAALGIEVLTNAVAGILVRQPASAVGSVVPSVFAHLPDAPAFDPRSYRSRPLNGVWATAPFLHNGSVPTLWELLKPSAQRIDSFYVGNRAFDPLNVGYLTTIPPDGHATLLDTSVKGNSNAGHDYGVHLDSLQKRHLIEYIKSL